MKVLDQITETLYEQTMDAQDGVIYFLLDQMADQHVKELLLAYFLLLQLGKLYLTAFVIVLGYPTDSRLRI